MTTSNFRWKSQPHIPCKAGPHSSSPSHFFFFFLWVLTTVSQERNVEVVSNGYQPKSVAKDAGHHVVQPDEIWRRRISTVPKSLQQFSEATATNLCTQCCAKNRWLQVIAHIQPHHAADKPGADILPLNLLHLADRYAGNHPTALISISHWNYQLDKISETIWSNLAYIAQYNDPSCPLQLIIKCLLLFCKSTFIDNTRNNLPSGGGCGFWGNTMLFSTDTPQSRCT